MNYDELRKIARPHVREGEKLPSNAFLLLTQLHIPFKSEKQCEEDFMGKMNPLYNNPAFLAIDASGNKTVYFNSKTKYWNFYIFHEMAHYLLGHEGNSTQNETDADMLACILVAPIENLPSYLKSARDISSLCQIPIDKAEMYWQEIKRKFYKKFFVIGCIFIFIILLTCLFLFFDTANKETKSAPETTFTVTPSSRQYQDTNKTDTYYKTSSGERYHIANCRYIKNKTNVVSVSIEEATKFNLLACEECIK